MPPKRQRAMTGTVSRSSKKSKSSAKTNPKTISKQTGPLPVTLLSGFLGSGKTTLLQHILKADHGLRIAVIVNDIGTINIDAASINTRVTQTKEKVIALTNGCICCTLRGDLLSELITLSEKHSFDYVIIESSGISEPAQVAESFDAGLSEHMLKVAKDEGNLDPALEEALKKLHEAGDAGLAKFARLDTTVTVIDAFTMVDDFFTQDFLSNRQNNVVPEDERTVSHLMVDQIEFADVIILNKVDMVSEEALAKIEKIVFSLNHRAKILRSCYGAVDVDKIVNTKCFDLEVARTGPGWLQDLHDFTIRQFNGKNVITPTPETEEYGVRNFIYSRRRPFHPERLMRLVYDKFILQLEHPEVEEDEVKDDSPEKKPAVPTKSQNEADHPEDDEWEDDDSASEEDDSPASSGTRRKSSADTGMTSQTGSEEDDDDHEDDLIQPPHDIILENKKAHPLFADLFRSKGMVWLATRPDYSASWSQAGAMLALLGDRRWFCTLTDEEREIICPDAELMKQIDQDILAGNGWGDRRQELVFIGHKLDTKGIANLLDTCLLNDEEWETWQSNMRKVQDKQQRLREIEREYGEAEKELEKTKDNLTWELDDGFPDWEAHFVDEEPDEDDDDEEDDDNHAGHHHH